MKKVLLICFSGTGNTFLCAESLKKHFEERNIACDIFRFFLPVQNLPDPKDYDLLGIGYPIHAFNTPLSFLNFLKHDCPSGQRPFFVFKVSGEPFSFNDSSSLSLVRILRKKGYSFLGEKHFLMPYNIVFRYPDALAKEMVLYEDALSALFVEELEKGERQKTAFPFFSRLVSFFFKIEWLAPSVNARFVKVDAKKCKRCFRCVTSCPNRALYLDKKGHIRANNHCSICMRCVDFCPTDAFHFGFLNSWKVVGKYDYQKYLSEPTLSADFLKPKMRGFFRHFWPYFAAANRELLAHQRELPILRAPSLSQEDEN
jgi:ferredoxin